MAREDSSKPELYGSLVSNNGGGRESLEITVSFQGEQTGAIDPA